jgi:hypothetical protein
MPDGAIRINPAVCLLSKDWRMTRVVGSDNPGRSLRRDFTMKSMKGKT